MTQPAPAQAQSAPPSADPAPGFLPPLKPQRKLFAILSVIVALWVAALIGMYIKWVWPERRAADTVPARTSE